MEDPNRSLTERLTTALGDAYTLEGEIGRGGMGVVYSARDQKLKRRVAVKVLPPELAFRDEIRTRFLREAETAAALSHPHIVPIFAVGEANGLVYFVMAYVDGESLSAKLRRRGRLPPEEVRRIMKETADALSGAHAVGIIHRDVKPDNILLEGTRGRVMVTDFGIAKALTQTGAATLTGTGVAIGTPAYMSPEQAAGDRDLDGRSDIYSLGVCAYQGLTGEPPFRAKTVAKLLLKQITEPAPAIREQAPSCPPDLAAAIERCLDKDPEDRWPTADALRRALESRSAVSQRPRAARHRPRAAPRRPVSPAPSAVEAESLRGGEWPARRDAAAVDLPRRAAGPRPAPQRTKAAGESAIVKRFRDQFASWASVCGGLLLLDWVTPGGPWWQWVAIFWGIFGVVPSYRRLWLQGYSWRDVAKRPPAPDAVEAQLQKSAKSAAAVRELPPPSPDEFGAATSKIKQAHRDREAIIQILDRLPKAERKLLPEIIPTVDSLLQRATDLAQALNQMSGDVHSGKLAQLDQRITDLAERGDQPELKRQGELLNRQRVALKELLQRREKVESQLESCLLAIQNMRFDLLRLRSAGIEAVLSDLTQATQQAHALAVDVDAAIDAAHEIREALRR